MRVRNYLLVAGLATAMTACASAPTQYGPASEGDRGYSELRIEESRYRVRFSGGSDITFDEAEDLALRRAAELTLENGGSWFLVVSRSREGNDRNPVGLTGGARYSTGSGGWSSSGVGLGVRIDGDAGEKSVSLEIVIRDGDRPRLPDAYDAQSVLAYSED